MIDNDGDRLARLEQQIAAILRRLEGLEARAGGLARSASNGGRRAEAAEDEEDEEDEVEGTLAFVGSIRRDKQRFSFRHRANLAEALEAEPEAVARVFAALGSPFRVRLLRALLEGPRTSQELQAELEVGAVGRLYHHLKELLAAGLIALQKRSVYAIRQEMVMPLCLAFVVAPRLAPDKRPAPQPDEESPKPAQ